MKKMERNGKRTERPLPQNAGARPRNTARNRSAAPQNMRVRAGGRRRKRGPNRGCFVVVLLCLLAAITLAVVWLTWDQQPEGDPVLPAEEQEQTTQPSEETPQEQPSDQQQTEEQPADEEQTGEQTEEQSQYEQLAQQFAQEKQEYYLLLANTDNPLPEDWTVETEEVQNGYEMDARVAPAMREMIDAAAADGVDLLVCSAYRSIEKQQSLFDTSVQNYMAQGMTEEEATAKTATETAIPGTSEHQTGLAADIVTPTHQTLDPEFADTEAGQWLSEHAYEYGFVLRYPADKQDVTGIIYESWHYRFVGKTHAKLMKESGLCLEEYLQQEVPEGYTGIADPYADPQTDLVQ